MYNEYNWNYYKLYRQFVQREIKRVKRYYYANLINTARPHSNWEVINKLSSKTKTAQDITELTYNGTTLYESIDISNALNHFFTNIGPEINNSFTNTNKTLELFWQLIHFGFKFNEITCTDIINIIKSLKNNKTLVENAKYLLLFINL